MGVHYTPLDQREQGLKLLQEAHDAIDRFNDILSTIASPEDGQQWIKNTDDDVAMPTQSRAMITETMESDSHSSRVTEKKVGADREVRLPQESIILDPDEITTGGVSVSCDNVSRSHDNGSVSTVQCVNGDSCDLGAKFEANLSSFIEDEMLCNKNSAEIINKSTTDTISQQQSNSDQCSNEEVGIDAPDGGKVGLLFGDLLGVNHKDKKGCTTTSNDGALCEKREGSNREEDEERMERSLVEFDTFVGEFNSPDEFLSKVYIYILYSPLITQYVHYYTYSLYIYSLMEWKVTRELRMSLFMRMERNW